ncbi:hypothetical protein FCV25MIE_33030 [Fagus crenata]
MSVPHNPGFLPSTLLVCSWCFQCACCNSKSQIILLEAEVRLSQLITPRTENIRPTTRWIRPPSGVFKLNCDAAFWNGASYLAIVVRNYLGHLFSASIHIALTPEPLLAEAEALLWALRESSNFLGAKATSILVEGDN